MGNIIFWVALLCYAIHILEEFFYDWKSWARNVLKLQVEWNGFYVVNTVVLFMGVACASVGWNYPAFALAFPALMLINAIFFHVLPTIITKKFSPGLITALILFLPVGIEAFRAAILIGVPTKLLLLSVLTGLLLMAYPIILIKTKELPFFKQ
ncbi:HXXEE domain-containing protein [Mucilaginibacter arboris]|uniref:HXXEE domain-containing protein n=1 Tax=Mucilaginibacter arboris TaxID=2682090 RepID=A0A7K1SZ16_9SPHI|nr:HXXEE domain-containing protein [Mucilaginibacter arboris]MVN22551.1 HXXEE domain-containing protein [Mucilaginibacter arboris]